MKKPLVSQGYDILKSGFGKGFGIYGKKCLNWFILTIVFWFGVLYNVSQVLRSTGMRVQ